MTRAPAPLVAARDALKTYWASALLILAAGAIALAAVIPMARLARSAGDLSARLRFSTVRISNLGFHWGSNASAPGDAQAETVGLLFQLMLVAAFATLVLAGLSILSISAARASARFPEIAVRRAVGASRRNLFLAALAEGGAIGTAALVVGIGAGILGLVAALAGWPGEIQPGSLSPGVLAAASVALTIVIGGLFQLLSTPSRRIVEPSPHSIELYIPALQLGMGLSVLVASVMLVRHAEGLVSRPVTGAGAGEVFELVSSDSNAVERARGYAALLEQLHQDPGIATASLVSPGAVVGLGMEDALTTDCGFCRDGGVIIKWHVVFTTHQFVSADTFGALGIKRLEGRLLTDADRWDSPPVAVISRSLASRHFQDGQALGRQILLKLAEPEWYTVVGVVEDRVPLGFGGEVQPRAAIYLSVLQLPPATADLLIRPASGSYSPQAVTGAIQNRVAAGELPSITSEQALLERESRPLGWFGRWFGLLGWAMLLITTASTFVLMRLWVRSLRSELGLHRAVGARRFHLLRYVLIRALGSALAGVAIALWFGPALWESLPEMVPGLASWNLGIVAPLSLVLVAIAVAGALLPAIRATRETPIDLIGSIGE
jgi:putative ABC transport system permease protein